MHVSQNVAALRLYPFSKADLQHCFFTLSNRRHGWLGLSDFVFIPNQYDMRSAVERLTSKLRSLLTQSNSNALGFDISQINELLRGLRVTQRCSEKINELSGGGLKRKKKRWILSDGAEDTGSTFLCDKPKNPEGDTWVPTATSPCATSDSSGTSGGSTSDGPTNEKFKVGRDLFKMFVEQDGKISVNNLINKTGIRLTDPRLKTFVAGLKLNQLTGSSTSPSRLTSTEFLEHLDLSSHALLSKALRDHLIIQNFPEFCEMVEKTYIKCKENKSGKVATYIPQLALVPPCHFGVSICTVDGQRFSVGDVNNPFTLQSMSKPLTYALSLEHLGGNVVHGFVGQEPSGRIFNELVLDNNNKPHNPMVNAGAIIICSLLLDTVQPETVLAEKFNMVSDYITRLAGPETIGFNNGVFLSEREAADRNYAIAFLLRENRCFPPNVDLQNVMDFYFQCCSIYGNCESVAVIGATLANGGTCPLTEDVILHSESVRDTLSLMHSCGMYDYSGQFAFKVGIPAKSGVSGGILAVIPNVLGLCCWSPALDPLGNSARGLQFCEERYLSNGEYAWTFNFWTVKEFVSSMNFHPYGIWTNANSQHILGFHNNKIFNAAYVGDMVTLNRILQGGGKCTEGDRDGRTPLHIAAAEGHYAAALLLLKYGQSACCKKDKWGRIPLDEAKHFGNEEIVKLLETKTAKCTEMSTTKKAS